MSRLPSAPSQRAGTPATFCIGEVGAALDAKRLILRHAPLAKHRQISQVCAMDVRRIIIIGGGNGGLAAGLALQRRGFRVAVYERAQEIREIGAGLIVFPNARRALRDLGVDAALEAISSCVPVMLSCDYATGAVLSAATNEQYLAEFGCKVPQVHRADLHGLLLEALRAGDPECLYPGHEFVGLEEDAEGVSVSFVNGASVRGDVVIGADGKVGG